MAKHVFYDVDEFLEKTKHEFEEGMNALDSLESEIRASLDRLTAMQFHTEPPSRRPRAKKAGSPRRFMDQDSTPLPTAADHAAADLLAQELAGG